MSYENIKYEEKEGVAIITFNRPKALNALNNDLLSELSIALDEVEGNEDIRVLILTGAGEKAFVAGADINELAKLNPLEAKLLSERGHSILAKIESMPKPVIAAVNGFALGGGSEIALACDFRYASATAKFGLPEINLGIMPGYGGTQRLPRLIGMGMAKELMLTGKMIDATEAKEIGLVNKVFEAENLMAKTMDTAKEISKKGKVAIRAIKQSINWGCDESLNTGNSIETNHFALVMVSEDAKEGMSAFVEKRPANFTGRLQG